MNKLSLACAASVISAALITPVAATAAPVGAAAILALEGRFSKAVNAKDVDAIMAVYSPDVFVFDVVPPRQYVGAEAYRGDWKGIMGGYPGPLKFEITDLVISTDGIIGYSHSIQRMVGKDARGAVVDMTVRVSDVYRKVGGAWRIIQEHVSVPVDLGTGKPDMTSKP